MLAFLALIIEQKLGDGTPCLYLSLTMEMAVPRDRNGEYQPQLIKKYQNKELYDIDISDSTTSRSVFFAFGAAKGCLSANVLCGQSGL